MKALGILGGPPENWPIDIKDKIKKAQDEGTLIATSDRSSLFLLEMGIVPDLAVGDFDSLKKTELSKVESNVVDIRYARPEKDETDSEMLLTTLFEDYQVDSIDLYGATGGRLDHFFVNIFTFLNPPLNKYCEKVRIIDYQNIIQFLKPGHNILKSDPTYKYLGISNLTAIKNLNIKGAKYPLANFNASFPRMFSSNEFDGQRKIEVNFEQGLVMIIYSHDKNRFRHI